MPTARQLRRARIGKHIRSLNKAENFSRRPIEEVCTVSLISAMVSAARLDARIKTDIEPGNNHNNPRYARKKAVNGSNVNTKGFLPFPKQTHAMPTVGKVVKKEVYAQKTLGIWKGEHDCRCVEAKALMIKALICCG